MKNSQNGRVMPKFTTLGEAARFLACAVESNDTKALAAGCHSALPPKWVIDRLRERNIATPLVNLYEGKEFPSESDDFRLGGYAKELGHIQIDFVKSDGAWEIEQIWMSH